ncbi:hypothetical protein BGP78_13965 [Pseudoalteromonas sp. MSK9-3]|uniref:hypothetical protein n=1 Tax=Pseudoalteromonas sp. MSK9-3 TaxID=1897633 RepID=UPI000E6C70D2|nr:hypothetical protein [Pseudoalteromonas sp. MSK9-3]RJE76115.1 hypothetical protein BGP78_13965 [Pseudoalteromonas sp. MSK9-3]
MELSQDTPLSLPLFLLNDEIESRDIEAPDVVLNVVLDEALLANLCQNPNTEQSVSITLEQYQLEVLTPAFSGLLESSHQAQLLLNHGPVLSAVLSNDAEQMFISPPMEMMPTFDLGEEVEEE